MLKRKLLIGRYLKKTFQYDFGRYRCRVYASQVTGWKVITEWIMQDVGKYVKSTFKGKLNNH